MSEIELLAEGSMMDVGTAKMGKDEIVEKMQETIAQCSTKLTVRQMYHCSVAAGHIVKSQPSYKRVGQILVDARNDGDINYENIEDEDSEGGDD